MSCLRTWKVWGPLLILFVLGGCGRSDASRISALPSHGLDLSTLPPHRPVRVAPQPEIISSPRPSYSGPRDWAAVGNRSWRYIVIHHSATERGNAATFDKAHRKRGWDELGYHFVIDNGRGGPDGKVEVGPRWRSQKWGAHCGGTPNNEYNELGIGICVVGDFTRRGVSRAQQEALLDLVGYLAAEYDIPAQRVIAHRHAPNANTACPGKQLETFLTVSLRRHLQTNLAATR